MYISWVPLSFKTYLFSNLSAIFSTLLYYNNTIDIYQKPMGSSSEFFPPHYTLLESSPFLRPFPPWLTLLMGAPDAYLSTANLRDGLSSLQAVKEMGCRLYIPSPSLLAPPHDRVPSSELHPRAPQFVDSPQCPPVRVPAYICTPICVLPRCTHPSVPTSIYPLCCLCYHNTAPHRPLITLEQLHKD